MYGSRMTSGGKERAIFLISLVFLLPWSTYLTSVPDHEAGLEESQTNSMASTRTWGVNGTNDSGWIVLEAEGADPENGTPAIADLMLEFAPGSQIDNLTLEIALNGSDGFWINQPQLTVMDTQTSILDWSGMGDLGGRIASLTTPTVTGGILDSP